MIGSLPMISPKSETDWRVTLCVKKLKMKYAANGDSGPEAGARVAQWGRSAEVGRLLRQKTNLLQQQQPYDRGYARGSKEGLRHKENM